MAIGWFIVPYVTPIVTEQAPVPSRELLLNQQPLPVGVEWQEREIMGNRAIVKMKAPDAVLSLVAALPGVKRIPRDALNDPIADLPNGVKRALRDEMVDQGYTIQQVRARFGNDFAEEHTLADVLKFMASHWRKPRRGADGALEFGDPQDVSARKIKGKHPIEWLDEVVKE